MATFGERIKELRTEKRLTQDKLGDMFKLNKSSISRYENGLQIPEMDTLQALADYFDVTVDYLLGKTNIRKLEGLAVPQGYLRVAKEALEKGLSPEDVSFAINWLISARERDK